MTTETLDQARERLRPYVERAKGFTGWDFSHVRTKTLPPAPPWSYVERARQLLAQADSALDIGTGGGEVYSDICEGLRLHAIATEGWAPNSTVAYKRLYPLGIDVVQCEDQCLPFKQHCFDVVLNRHAGWTAEDLARILKPGGTFLSQQVDSGNWREIRRYFPRRQFDFNRSLLSDVEEMAKAGLEVNEVLQHERGVAYQELGDLVMNLIMTPWEIMNFDPLGADLEALLKIEADLATDDGILLTEGRALIEAHKPA